MTDPQYHLTCEVCDELFWSADAFAKRCSHCSDDVVFTMIDKLYPAKWDPKGADECGILYCHGIDYAFGIDPDETEDWWGPQLAEAINDAHDLRAEVERLHEEAHWIPTAERMPDPHLDVLLVHSAGDIEMGYYDPSTTWYWVDGMDRAVRSEFITHWRPLPARPEVTP